VANGIDFNTRTGDLNVDGLLIGTQWNTTALTFAFPTSNTYFTQPYEIYYDENNIPITDNTYVTNFQAFNASWQAAARIVLNQYAAVTNLSFTEVSPTTQADVVFSMTNSTNVGTANGRFPGYTANEGHQWYRVSNYETTAVIGTYTWATILHETGHTMGLAHGHSADTITAIPGAVMNADRDSMEFTVMTYRSYEGAPADYYRNETFGFAQTLMMYDIAALQLIYGADYVTNAGANVYTFSSTTGEMFIDGAGQGTPGANRIFRTVWDGGGVDTYDLSNYTTNLDIDLTPGSWSTFSAVQVANLGDSNFARGNVFNALLFNNDARSLIENAIGGTGNDRIEGNRAINTLRGNNGEDTLIGAGGNDNLYGGEGNDTIWGDREASPANPIGFGSGLHTHANVYDSVALAFNITALFSLAANANIGNATTVPHVTLRYSDGALGQKQYYKVSLSIGSTITIDVDATALDSVVYLYGADGVTLLAKNDESIGLDPGSTTTSNSFLTYTVLTSGFFYIAIDDYFSIGALPATTYDLNISVSYIPVLSGEDGTPGNDTIYGGGGNDTANGGGGNDIIYGGIAAVDATETGDDFLYGNAGLDTIYGNGGNDTISGGLDADYLIGGTGNDTIYGGLSSTDTTDLSDDFIRGGDGIDTLYGNGGDDTIAGGAGVDTIYGGVGDDLIYGGALLVDETDAGDTIYGGDGNDDIRGNGGDDFIYGGTGNDSIIGGVGADTIYGGLGNDYLRGGLGADRFYFSTAPNAATNMDTIQAFVVGTDKIVLSQAIFAGIGGTLDAAEFQLGAAANDINDRIIYNQATGQLFYDSNGNVNGSTDQVLFSTLTAPTGVLTIADFAMVA
jgi:serralysin